MVDGVQLSGVGVQLVVPGSATPSGPAGGALAGTYPNPTLAGVITAGGPTGSGTAIPVVTYNAAGQLTAVTTAVPSVTSARVLGSYDLTTASGTQTVSGFGFTPRYCEGFGSVNGTLTIAYYTANAFSDTAMLQSNVSAYQGAIWHNAGGATFFFVSDLGGTNYQTGSITAYNNGSVTISWTKTGSPTGTFTFSITCFR